MKSRPGQRVRVGAWLSVIFDQDSREAKTFSRIFGSLIALLLAVEVVWQAHLALLHGWWRP